MKLLEALFARLDGDPSSPMPTFDGAGWLNEIKILKCKDDLALLWVKEGVTRRCWEGQQLQQGGW